MSILFNAARPRHNAAFAIGVFEQKPVRLPIGADDADRAFVAAQHDDADGVTIEEEENATLLRTMSRAEWLAHQTTIATARLVAVVGDAAPSYACQDRPTVCDCPENPPCEECDGSGWVSGPSIGFSAELLAAVQANDAAPEPTLAERGIPQRMIDAMLAARPGDRTIGEMLGEAEQDGADFGALLRAAVDAADAAEDYCGTCGEPAGRFDGSCPDCRPKTGPGSRGGKVKNMTLHQAHRAAAKAKRLAAKGQVA